LERELKDADDIDLTRGVPQAVLYALADKLKKAREGPA